MLQNNAESIEKSYRIRLNSWKKVTKPAQKVRKKLRKVLYMHGKMLQYYILERDNSIKTLKRKGVTGNVKKKCISATFGLEKRKE